MFQLYVYAATATATAVALQVLLPRLFSVILWYHLGFFAVSLAMLGFALGGVIVRRRVSNGLPPVSRAAAPRASIAIVGALCLVVRLPIDPTSMVASFQAPLLLLTCALLLAIPFTWLGEVVCGVLEAGREKVGALYASTFLGGAIGAWIALAAMEWLGAARGIGLITLLPLLPSPLRSPTEEGTSSSAAKLTPRPALGGLPSAALILAIATLALPETLLPLRSRKHFPIIHDDQVLGEEWNTFSRVTFYENPNRDGLWEMPIDYSGALPESIGIAIDAWAITSILKREDVERNPRFLSAYPPTLAYASAPDRFDALVIGAGGGVDVLGALHHGAGHVTAVEINPLIADAVLGRFTEFAGDLYRDPRVELHVEEGRHFVDNDDRLYDRIMLSGVDTFAATEAGAFALSENYLYTVEAIESYYHRLKEGGILAMTRWWFDPPRQTLRLALTAAEALRNLGVDDPSQRIAIAVTERTQTNSLFLMKKGEFTDAEIAQLEIDARGHGAAPIYFPGRPSHPTYSRALAANGFSDVIAESHYLVEPTRDDRPFFFENSRWSNAFQGEGDWIHDRFGGMELLLSTTLALLLLSIPIAWFGLRSRPSNAKRSGGWRTGLPFFALGFAYMAIEIPLLQRLSLPLGHPVFAVSVALVSLLIGSGLGAWYADRMTMRRGLPAAAAISAGLISVVILTIGYPELLDATRHAATWQRAVAVILFLALPSFTMGMPFPLALRTLADRPGEVPIAFVANGVASVVAGPIVVLIAMEIGFRGTFILGACAYGGAALLLNFLGESSTA